MENILMVSITVTTIYLILAYVKVIIEMNKLKKEQRNLLRKINNLINS